MSSSSSSRDTSRKRSPSRSYSAGRVPSWGPFLDDVCNFFCTETRSTTGGRSSSSGEIPAFVDSLAACITRPASEVIGGIGIPLLCIIEDQIIDIQKGFGGKRRSSRRTRSMDRGVDSLIDIGGEDSDDEDQDDAAKHAASQSKSGIGNVPKKGDDATELSGKSPSSKAKDDGSNLKPPERSHSVSTSKGATIKITKEDSKPPSKPTSRESPSVQTKSPHRTAGLNQPINFGTSQGAPESTDNNAKVNQDDATNVEGIKKQDTVD